MRKQRRQKYTGPLKRGMIVNKYCADFGRVADSISDAFVGIIEDLRRRQVEDICRWFAVPPHIINK